MSDNPAATSGPLRPWERAISIAWRTTQELAEFALLIVVVGGALLAISEISTRDGFQMRVEKQLKEAQAAADGATTTYELKRQAARLARAELTAIMEGAPEYPERKLAQTQADSEKEDAKDAARYGIERVAALIAAQTALANASAIGIDSNSPSLRDEMKSLQIDLKRIAEEERELRTPSAFVLSPITSPNIAARSVREPAGRAPGSSGVPTSAALFPLFFDRLRSEHLLAGAVVLSSVLGSLLAVVRQKNLATVRTVTVGAATGFIVYLALKGGRYVFLMQLQGDAIAFNPYSSAFAGLVAGLFSDIAYSVLSALVTDFANRIKQAFLPPGDNFLRGGPFSPQAPPGDNPADELAQKRAQNVTTQALPSTQP